jgi:hypothetical protein
MRGFSALESRVGGAVSRLRSSSSLFQGRRIVGSSGESRRCRVQRAGDVGGVHSGALQMTPFVSKLDNW